MQVEPDELPASQGTGEQRLWRDIDDTTRLSRKRAVLDEDSDRGWACARILNVQLAPDSHAVSSSLNTQCTLRLYHGIYYATAARIWGSDGFYLRVLRKYSRK